MLRDSRLVRAPGVLKARLLRRPIGMNVAAAIGRELRPEKWVFIVGCYNSGTTLLHSILSKHPAVGALPYEGVRLTDRLPIPEHFGWPRLWQICESEMAVDEGRSAAAARIKRQWSFSYPRRRPVLIEKSIANTCRMDFLENHFAPAHFVHIVRNGYAVAEGIRRKAVPARWGNHDFPDGYPIEYCARQWSASCETVDRAAGAVRRFKQITYEELCEDPGRVIASVLEFLSLDADHLEDMIRPQRVHGETRPIRNLNARSLEALSDEDLATIEANAGPWLDRFGYARVGSGAEAPD